MKRVAHDRIVGSVFQKREHAHRLQEVVRVDCAEQRMWSNPEYRGQQVTQSIRMPCADQFIAKDFVDSCRRRIGTDAAVPAAQLVQRARLESRGWLEVLDEQARNAARRQTDLLGLQRAKIDRRVPLLTLEHLPDP